MPIKKKCMSQISWGSLQYAIVTFVALFNYILGIIVGGFGIYFSLLSIVVIEIICLLNKKKKALSLAWIGYFILLVFYIVSRHNSQLSSFQAVTFIIVPAIVAKSRIEMKSFITYSCYSALLLLIVFKTFVGDIMDDEVRGVSVNGLSYAVLPIVLSGLFHFVFFREESNWLIKICYVIDLSVALLLIIYANRGVVFSIIISIFLLYIFSNSSTMTAKDIVRMCIVLVLILIIYTNFDSIMFFFHDQLQHYGIEVKFIDKMLALSQKEDISNGRSSINQYIISHLGDNPLFGHGMSTIYYNSGGSIIYPHNMILQLLYDGGLILALPIYVLLIKMIYQLFNSKDTNHRIVILYFIALCIPKLMLSSDIWTNPSFWLFIFCDLNNSWIGDDSKKKIRWEVT